MQAEVSKASLGNPGIPPSSLTSFLKAKPEISGILFQIPRSKMYFPEAVAAMLALECLKA